MAKYQLKTTRGYDFYEVASAMQKAVRRADTKVAGYFALELWESGFRDYVWKRLMTISAEDCYGLITGEIKALYDGHQLVNCGREKKSPKGRIFVSKAVILLCSCRKNRDADHLQNFIYDKKLVDDVEWLEDARREPLQIPEYTYDVHTKKGKLMGKTKEQFFHDEHAALSPFEPGLFDNLVP